MKNTTWKYSINFINTLEDNTVFDARLMLEYVRKRKPHTKPNTLLWHRVILARLGFLNQIRKGLWKKLQTFPDHIGKSRAEKVAFSKYKWQSWFIPAGWIAESKTQKSEVATNGRLKGGISI